MIKRGIAIVAVAALAVVAAYAFGFATPRDLAQFPDCLSCGMSRKSCAHTRMVVEYADGTKRAECGLHCLLVDLVDQPGRQPKRMFAADYNDRKLAEAEKSWWVRYDNAVECRGSKVMLAFRSEHGADKFIASFGGRKLNFDEALKLTYSDLKAERNPVGNNNLGRPAPVRSHLIPAHPTAVSR
jgi:hypothetical protein